MKTTKILVIISLLAILLSLFSISVFADDYFILNTESGKYHRENCSYLPSPTKRERLDIDEINSYTNISPCQHCKPLDHIGDDYEEYEDPAKDNKDNRQSFIFAYVFVAILLAIILFVEKWIKDGPSKGRGLIGVAQDYFLKISYLTVSLPTDTRKHLLEEAYYVITKYKKEYSPVQNIEFLQVLFSDKYKDTVRVECFAISFLLSHAHRRYPSDDLGHKMAVAYYDDLERQLANLYDYCYLSKIYFPGIIVDFFCSDGYYILKKYSKYYEKEK